jgi:ornithine carrier protein
MFGAVLENAVLFVAYGEISKRLKAGSDETLSIGALTLSGALAGSAVSFVMTPVELVKCRMQTRKDVRSSVDAILKEMRANGVAGMYKGHLATFLRETFGGAAWFGAYELCCRTMARDGRKESLSALQTMAAGSIGGIGYNVVMFPADVVKVGAAGREPRAGSAAARAEPRARRRSRPRRRPRSSRRTWPA